MTHFALSLRNSARLRSAALSVFSLLAAGLPLGAEEPADLVLTGGRIITMDEAKPLTQALACRGQRIVAVGSDDEIAALIGEKTKVIPLSGQTALPGFIEGHGHFVSLGESKLNLDLTAAKSWEDVVEMVREAAERTPPGAWIVGRGWHQEKWSRPPEPNVEGYPVHAKLSAAAPKNPVLLTHASGHMSLANAQAMRLSGITKATPDPDGGQILRNAASEPIGAFRETAQSLVRFRHDEPQRRAERLDRAIELATEECLRKGITSFQDAGSSLTVVDRLNELAETGQLKVRLWVMLSDDNARLRAALPRYRLIGAGEGYLTVRAIKRSIDGALGSHGAWLLEPYSDLKTSAGLQTTSLGSLRETARLAAAHDYQLCVHAIGDRANREVLNLFERAFAEHPSEASRRWRVEHAQHLDASDIPRFSKLGVIASMQGVHCTSDAVFVIDRLGHERARVGAYAWRSLLDAGTTVINGTDAPVEDVDPLASFYASVTRKTPDGRTFFPQQRMTRVEALASYTTSAAYAAFEEDEKGSLAPGKLADIVVLSRDILTCPEKEILSTCVMHTIVGGRVAYSAPTADADTR